MNDRGFGTLNNENHITPITMIKIAVVGDIHEQWESVDNLALEKLGVNLALFVGDFGNESVEVVRQIASLTIPKAAIMGNHDAWYTASDWGRKKCPYDRTQEDRVQQQLDLLGETHVGFNQLDIPSLRLSVVGGRPFSWGGGEWKNRKFLRDRYGVTNFAESQAKILASVQETAYDTLIFLGHNGPLGLGDSAEAICGRDWQPLGGDHGDPDLAAAIAQTHTLGKHIPLVTFGHMHHRLRHTQTQLRTPVIQKQDTLYLNAARVPRIIDVDGEKWRNFSLVCLENHQVETIELVWVDEQFQVRSREQQYQRSSIPFVLNC